MTEFHLVHLNQLRLPKGPTLTLTFTCTVYHEVHVVKCFAMYYILRAGICQGAFEIVTKEVLWSVRGSYQTM